MSIKWFSVSENLNSKIHGFHWTATKCSVHMARTNWPRTFDYAVDISVCTPKQAYLTCCNTVCYLNTPETDFSLHHVAESSRCLSELHLNADTDTSCLCCTINEQAHLTICHERKHTSLWNCLPLERMSWFKRWWHGVFFLIVLSMQNVFTFLCFDSIYVSYRL